MKQAILLLCAYVIAMSPPKLSAQVKIPDSSPLATITQVIGFSTIKVDYSRPSIQRRVIFGKVVPYGQLWVTGDNGSTDITFSDDVFIGGKVVEAGSYALYTIPGSTKWTVILYKDTDIAGAPRGELKESMVAARFTIKPKVLLDKVETFTIEFKNLRAESADLDLSWENTLISIPLQFQTFKVIEQTIEQTMADGGNPEDYYNAAKFYLETGQELEMAHRWISKAVEMSESAYWMYDVKCRIEAKLGKKAMAAETERKYKEWSEKAQLFNQSMSN